MVAVVSEAVIHWEAMNFATGLTQSIVDDRNRDAEWLDPGADFKQRLWFCVPTLNLPCVATPVPGP